MTSPIKKELLDLDDNFHDMVKNFSKETAAIPMTIEDSPVRNSMDISECSHFPESDDDVI